MWADHAEPYPVLGKNPWAVTALGLYSLAQNRDWSEKSETVIPIGMLPIFGTETRGCASVLP
jgi:hypothetical protein